MALIERRGATASDLKWFGLVLAAAFGVLGAFAWWNGQHALSVTLWSSGAGLALIYYAVRPIQPLIHDAWMGLTFPIGWVISNVVMLIMFYLVITPIGGIMRMVGYDPLNRGFDRTLPSHWVVHDQNFQRHRYFRQF